MNLPYKIIKTAEFNEIVQKIARLQAEKIIQEEREKIEEEISRRVNAITDSVEFVDELRSGVDVYLDLQARGYEVFSVERVEHGSSKEHSIVGYFWEDQDGRHVKEWKLYISRKHHNQLIQEFKLKKGTNII